MSAADNPDKVVIQITREEREALLIVVGYATGVASREGFREMIQIAIKALNAVNRNNPGWIPYRTEGR